MSAYQESIKLVEGTAGKTVNLQFQDEDGNGVDISGCTVTWAVWESEAANSALRVTCVAVDLPTGKVKYVTEAGDWAEAKLQGGKEYKSCLIAVKTGFYEEAPEFTVTTIKKAPPAPA